MIRFGGNLQNPISREALSKATSEMERLGFDSVWFEDHLVMSLGSEYMRLHKETPPRSVLEASMLECWTTLSWLAAQTKKIRLGPFVLCNSFRQPSLVAKMASTFDVLSEGRLEFGIGAGYWKPEFEMYGIPLHAHRIRTEQLAEAIQVIRSMWTQDVTNFDGKYYAVRLAPNNPKPLQKPHPPITIGGGGQRIMKVAAQFADNWNLPGAIALTPEEYGEIAKRFDEYCRQAGRSRKDIVKSVNFARCVIDKDLDKVREKAKRLKPAWESLEVFNKRLIGTPQQWVEKLNRFKDRGVEYFLIDFPDPTDFKSMELFAENVIPAFK